MFKRRGKRASAVVETTMFHLFDIVLVVALIGMAGLYVESLRNNTLIEQKFLAKDLSAVYFAAQSVEGDLNLDYKFDRIESKDYNFEFSENQLIVRNSKAGFPYSYPTLFKKNQIINKPSKIKITKTEGRVDLD
jgi:hypothetical protein